VAGLYDNAAGLAEVRSLRFEGGSIFASGNQGAGIGNGMAEGSTARAVVGDITFVGGYVEASCSQLGAGIGVSAVTGGFVSSGSLEILNGTIVATGRGYFGAIGGSQDYTQNSIDRITLGGSPNLTLSVDKVGIPAIFATAIELANITLWALVDGTNLTFGVKPDLEGELNLTIIYSHKVSAFIEPLDNVSLVQFGEINFRPLDIPAHFWNLTFRTRDSDATRWFDGSKMSLLVTLQPGWYTCRAENEDGRH
jgi:hypothetical protein